MPIDMKCNYINNEWQCQSPKLGGDEAKCISSNYNQCPFYPQLDLRTKVPFERENDLEKENKGKNNLEESLKRE